MQMGNDDVEENQSRWNKTIRQRMEQQQKLKEVVVEKIVETLCDVDGLKKSGCDRDLTWLVDSTREVILLHWQD